MTPPPPAPAGPTYVLIPGAGGDAAYWYLVVAELRRRGRDAVAVTLPAGDPAAGFAEYTDAAVAAIGDRRTLVVVAQSMGAYVGPLVCERVPVDLLVLLNPMVPAPGETAGAWWVNTGQAAGRAAFAAQEGRSIDGEFDLLAEFFHDVPDQVTAEIMAQGEPGQSDTPFGQEWPLARWPDVPIRVVQGRDDRLFPLEFQRRVVRERLGLDVDELPGGHLLALSRPAALVDRLEDYWAELG
jgi:pimeloyl-ACP methyl ester carboxylesterase